MLNCKQLQFNYPKSRPILKSVDLNFGSGNIYGLFGKNGEGKSTLMKLVCGLLTPEFGYCTLFGESTHARSVQTLKDLFFIPEDFELPALPIYTFEKINSVFYPNFSREHFYTLIEEFRLYRKQDISKLSFGQKKKVLIAFGLATNTPLLLLDEPTNGLDIPSKSQFRKILASSINEDKCIIISTHQVRDLHSLIDHMVILDNAQVIFNQSLSTVSDALWFGRPSKENESEVLFSESTFGGRVILNREFQEESEVDLELLFNGVLSNPEKINSILKN
ncbi:ATP-binding cassette domain-containing protein [Flagellimonas meridianipacifica]|uniref:ABC-2 type transport system ATP-binding protein n=1 Tax=Flagellimonas meridianipacifica TaxID=1080225 RepID=A0A2T0MA43_9FLAO|nr:ATP-binding cassette domain-containing protein [Allomuricauda pacifica]PRX54384.1 ABC-2 type transport system ATP-binding protein [Allomuricauda pacifica]